MRPFVALTLLMWLGGAVRTHAVLPAQQTPAQKSADQARERAYARQQFTQNFRDLQLLGQGLLREHEARRLTAKQLAKDVKAINKCAKTLRSLMALGALAHPTEVNKAIDTPQEYDQAIRRLAKLIWDFAHSPHHQNSKIFAADEAARVQTNLLTIINLSKVLGDRAKSYALDSAAGQ